jgi:hypothetical protein
LPQPGHQHCHRSFRGPDDCLDRSETSPYVWSDIESAADEIIEATTLGEIEA